MPNYYLRKGLQISRTKQTIYHTIVNVVNVNKPGTVRVVFDASAKCDNISLNGKLLLGIDCLNSLVGGLTKFRHGKYAIIGVIEKMFLQLKVIEEDLDGLRFVWRNSDQDEISDYVMLSHLFGKKDYP